MKVGKYDIPDMRLFPLLYEATKKLYEHFKSEEAVDILTVANLLGHKTDKSGAFIRKLACLRAYGLIEKRGVKVTELGKKLTYGASEEERNDALKEAILNIPLWKEFYTRWGVNLPSSNFWVELTKIAGLEAPDAKRLEEIVRNAYLDDIRYLKVEKKPEEEGIEMVSEAKVDMSKAISRDVAAVEEQAEIVKGLIKYGAFDIAKEFIDFLKTKKEEKSETKG